MDIMKSTTTQLVAPAAAEKSFIPDLMSMLGKIITANTESSRHRRSPSPPKERERVHVQHQQPTTFTFDDFERFTEIVNKIHK